VVSVGGRIWVPISSVPPSSIGQTGVAVEGFSITGQTPPRRLPASSTIDIESVYGMVFGGGSLWIGDSLDGVVAKVVLTSGEHEEYPAGAAVDALAFGDGYLWVVDRFGDEITRIDPETGKIEGHRFVEGDPNSVVVGDGSVWVTDGNGDAVERIPTSFDAPSTTIRGVGGQPIAIAYAEGKVWVANHDDGTVSEIDPGTNLVVDTIPVGIHPSSVAVDGDQLWVTGNPSGIDRS
jgi:YVTN family beta-propeller protein